jgi:phosphonate transport system substrate-binding protein
LTHSTAMPTRIWSQTRPQIRPNRKPPNTLVFTYTPVEDPAVYEKIFKRLLNTCRNGTAKRVVFFQVQSNAAEIEAMRAGRLHVQAFPLADCVCGKRCRGRAFLLSRALRSLPGYNLVVIVKKGKQPHKLTDLKGKKLAHTLAIVQLWPHGAIALFPKRPDA